MTVCRRHVLIPAVLCLLILHLPDKARAEPSPPLKVAWRAQTDDPRGSFTTWPVFFEGKIFATSGSGAIAVTGTGERLWWRDLGGARQVFPAVDETGFYTPASLATLVKLDKASGETIWEARLPESPDSSPSLGGGRLFIGIERSKSFHAIEAETGKQLWERRLELGPDTTPVVSAESVVFSIEDLSGPRVLVLALDSESGETRWRVEQREGVSSPTLDGESVFIGGGDFYAYRLDLKTGFVIWRSRVEGKFGPRNMPAIAEGDVFLADRIGNIYRLDGKTGRRKWIFSDTEGTLDQSFPVVAGKTLYIGSAAGWLYGVNIDTGKLVWKDRVKGIVLSGAADAERFYFGVKFGDEGLYAYEHDPSGKVLQPERVPGVLRSLVGGLVLFVLLFAGVAFFVRRSRAKSS